MFVQFVRDYAFWITLFAGIAIGVGLSTIHTGLRRQAEQKKRDDQAAIDRETASEDLLSEYVDLLNEEGPNGPNTRAFLEKHAANTELIWLCQRAYAVQQQLKRGELQLLPGDEEAVLEEAARRRNKPE